MPVDKETEEKIQQLQIIEQNLQNFLLQKQQYQAQLTEIDSALSELKGEKTAYRIIGNIMVESKRENIEKDLKEKKKAFELRIKTLEKHEERIKEKAKILQTEVLGKIKDKK